MLEISVYSPKGGTSKSTIAANLAGAYARRGKAVVVVDLDRQENTFDVYASEEQTFTVVTCRPQNLAGIDVLIHDHHPTLADDVRLAPIVVCPVRPCNNDMQSWAKQHGLLSEHHVVLVASQIDYKHHDDRLIAAELVENYQALEMRHRPSYKAANNRGLTLWQYAAEEGRLADAKQEIETIREAIDAVA